MGIGSGMNGAQRAVFLDRDGVLNAVEVRNGVSHPPDSLETFRLLPGVPDALHKLKAAGYQLVVVTNQPDVARGAQTQAEVERIHAHLRETLPVLDIMVCYHDTPDGCSCRKPLPGMLLAAAERWNLDTANSYMIGDRWSDIVAGQAAGCCSVLIDERYSNRSRCNPDGVAKNLGEATTWILETNERRVRRAG